MKDLETLMKQAQAMQEKLQAAQSRLAEMEVEGAAGGGLVSVVMKGSGELTRVVIDESLMSPGEAEIVADLVVAAHADAKRKLDAQQSQIMREAAGPLADFPGLPKL
ncbi:MAG: YbaB/EbfC family nucleoid-associated protein [Caulobacterales bacterium]